MKNLMIAILSLFIFTNCNVKNEVKPIMLTDNGTWCWFSDPRAIYSDQDGGRLITGFVTSEGNVEALTLNLDNGETTKTILYQELEVDDHNNPAFLRRADGYYLAFYTKHHNTGLYMNMSLSSANASEWGNAMMINPNGKVDLEKYGDDKYTYANPMILKNENNRIYLFGRWIGFKPNMTWSDNGGSTWSEGRVVVCPQPFSWGQRPYVKYYSDGLSKIHMVFTDGHPRDEATNSVYYACYYDGAFHRANGDVICTIEDLPFEPKKATLVYDAIQSGQRAWVYDVFADEKGKPAIAYARYPTEEEHIYHYAWYDGENWMDKEMVNSGKWFPHTPVGKKEREPHYSGGLTIDPNHEHTLFISREVNNIFEIERWTYNIKTNNWHSASITQNSKTDQVRPYVVKNYANESLLLWDSVEHYIHYTNFKTATMLARIPK